ncbi:MAG: O-antigen ligase family protein [Flavobacteriales bacterium]|nr:O-antigen ligase family protein [Flavobacteriales bacterium]
MEDYKSIFKTRNLFLLCLFIIAIGLSLSKPLIALGQYGLLVLWLFSGGIKQKLISFFQNKTALALASLYILSLFGLLYTSNFDYAIDDIRRKIPLFFLPFYISGFSPITKKEFSLIFKVYVAGVLFATFWSVFVMLGGTSETIIDKRALSRYNSHIRFGLEICMAIFGSAYYFWIKKTTRIKIIWLAIASWLICFLFILSLFTGVVILILSSIFMFSIYSLRSKNPWLKYSFLFASLALIVLFSFTLKNNISNYYQNENIVQLEILEHTKSGEAYAHDTSTVRQFDKENGYYVWQNIAWKEIHTEWKKRSEIPFQANDLKDQKLTTTLIRFLSSKGVYKNADAIIDLSEKEIKAIEKGVSNYKYLSMNNIDKRLHKIIWEFDYYNQGRDYNGHSVIMRWAYWKTAYRIFKQNIFLGVGTGDVPDAFDKQYEKEKSLLLPRYRLRAHNQYITYAVTFGVLGLLILMLSLFYPFFKNKMYNHYLYLAFFSIILLSMLTEDTLETQVGITFFAFFNTIFLLKEKH